MMVNVTGNLNIPRISLPILFVIADDMYQEMQVAINLRTSLFVMIINIRLKFVMVAFSRNVFNVITDLQQPQTIKHHI